MKGKPRPGGPQTPVLEHRPALPDVGGHSPPEGLDVSVRTNPVFARFAAEYRACEDAVEGYAADLAGAGTQEELAERWLRTERELQTCSGEVTAGLFDRR